MIAISAILAFVLAAMFTIPGNNNLIVKTLVLLDCIVNVLLGGKFRETLSSRAHRMRLKQQPVWGWTAAFIDTLFFWEPHHCFNQWNYEVTVLKWHD